MATGKRAVLVIGAGASVAEANWHRPKRDRDYPPLDANFFSRAPRHAVGSLLEKVRQHAVRLGETNLFDSDPPVSLEQHVGRLFFDMQTDPGSANVSAYYDLIRLYSDELLATTSWMSGRRSGPLRRVIEAELRRGHDLSILTFNHDLLIENALVHIPSRSFGSVWCMKHAYGLGDLETIQDRTETFAMDCPGSRDDHIPLYKLHGSVNWVFKTAAENPPAEASRRRRQLLIWINRIIRPRIRNVRWTSRSGRGRGTWYLWSLIVPPIYEKSGFIRNELKAVWDSAAEDLEHADRVIFWGYSFPRADVYSRYFFQRAANANGGLRRPVLINPDPASHRELWTVIQPNAVEHYRDVRGYLLRNE
jgi:hypothetical protein